MQSSTHHLRTRMTYIQLRRNLPQDASGTGTNTIFVCFCSYLFNSLTQWIEYWWQPSTHARPLIIARKKITYLAPAKIMYSGDTKHNAAMMIPWAVFVSSPSFLPSNINPQPFINSYLFKTCHNCHVIILHFLSLPLRSTAPFWNPRISLSHIPIASILFLTIVLVPVVQWAMSEVSVGGTYWSNKLVLG